METIPTLSDEIFLATELNWPSSRTQAPLKVATKFLATETIAPRDTPYEWPFHTHAEHELLWGLTGSVHVETPSGLLFVPAGFDIWIPANTTHQVRLNPLSSMNCTWFLAEQGSSTSCDAVLVGSSVLLHEVLAYLDNPDLPSTQREIAETFVLGLIDSATTRGPTIPMPRDPELRRVANLVLDEPSVSRDLNELGALANRSRRSFTRSFLSETGMSFGQWQTTARVHCSLRLLAEGYQVTDVARMVGFGSSSSFISVFRRAMGTPPRSYINRLR